MGWRTMRRLSVIGESRREQFHVHIILILRHVAPRNAPGPAAERASQRRACGEVEARSTTRPA